MSNIFRAYPGPRGLDKEDRVCRMISGMKISKPLLLLLLWETLCTIGWHWTKPEKSNSATDRKGKSLKGANAKRERAKDGLAGNLPGRIILFNGGFKNNFIARFLEQSAQWHISSSFFRWLFFQPRGVMFPTLGRLAIVRGRRQKPTSRKDSRQLVDPLFPPPSVDLRHLWPGAKRGGKGHNAPGAKKSQQCRKCFLQYSTFAPERPRLLSGLISKTRFYSVIDWTFFKWPNKIKSFRS